MSIPRLELSGAVTACRLSSMVSSELDMKIDQTVFWTDSTILLGYRNVSKRFKTFVGNRLSIIHELSSAEQWRHVDSGSNPADIALRGIDANDREGLQIWFNGPAFLRQDSSSWPVCPTLKDVSPDDVEVKREAAVNYTNTSAGIDAMTRRYSSWTKLQRAITWLLRFKSYCRKRFLKHDVEIPTTDFTAAEVGNAKRAILKYVKQDHFSQEITALKMGRPVKTDSNLTTLNPVFHNGYIKVGGRQQDVNADRYPIILPSKHHVTRLIIWHYHKLNGHEGVQQVLATTRENYWVIRGPSTVKIVLKDCFVCKKQHSPLLTQHMGPLLPEQTTPEKPPFTFVGVDYFGPLDVKYGRSHLKRYGCLFTCLNTRAIHIEEARSLTTTSFIAAFQRSPAGGGCRRWYLVTTEQTS